jgi:hypothetical protein
LTSKAAEFTGVNITTLGRHQREVGAVPPMGDEQAEVECRADDAVGGVDRPERPDALLASLAADPRAGWPDQPPERAMGQDFGSPSFA